MEHCRSRRRRTTCVGASPLFLLFGRQILVSDFFLKLLIFLSLLLRRGSRNSGLKQLGGSQASLDREREAASAFRFIVARRLTVADDAGGFACLKRCEHGIKRIPCILRRLDDEPDRVGLLPQVE